MHKAASARAAAPRFAPPIKSFARRQVSSSRTPSSRAKPSPANAGAEKRQKPRKTAKILDGSIGKIQKFFKINGQEENAWNLLELAA
jgi:hypothetical protein